MKRLIKYTERLLKDITQANLYAPFPVYDTEYVQIVSDNLDNMKNNKYNEAPVTACKYCDNLFILVDDLENDVCTKCGSVNETTTYKDIYTYLDKKGENEHN